MKNILLIISFLVVISSCKISQEFYFHEDFSGEVTNTFDLNTLMGFATMTDSTGKQVEEFRDSMLIYFNETKSTFDNIEGISNVQVGWQDNSNIIYLSYHFSDIDALNNLFNSNTNAALFNSLGSQAKPPKFEVKGERKIYYDAPELDSVLQEEINSMKGFYEYSLTLRFDKKIRKVLHKDAKLSEDKKSIKITGSLFDVMNDEKENDIQLKLK